MLINQNRVPVWVHGRKAAGPGRILIHLTRERDALGLQRALPIANVGKGAELLGVALAMSIISQRAVRHQPVRLA